MCLQSTRFTAVPLLHGCCCPASPAAATRLQLALWGFQCALAHAWLQYLRVNAMPCLLPHGIDLAAWRLVGSRGAQSRQRASSAAETGVPWIATHTWRSGNRAI